MDTPALVEKVGPHTRLEHRRSPRIQRAVRLMILGQDLQGQPYREKMSTISFSLHGCCYHSRHYSQIGAKVQLQLIEGLEEKLPVVSASVRFVRSPMSPRELYQTGVEFDTLPQDWLRVLEQRTTVTDLVPPAAVPAMEPEKDAAAAAMDRLVGVLQCNLEHAAEKAVQAAIKTQLEEAVRQAVSNIGEISSASARQAEVLSTQRLRLEQSFERAVEEFEAAATRVTDRQLVRLTESNQVVMRETWAQVDACTAGARAALQSAVTSTLEEFRRQLEVQMDLAISEARQRADSSLACLEAENRTACEAQRRSLENDVAQMTEKAVEQFRSGIKAFLYASLVAAVGAVDQHAQTTLAGLVGDQNAPGV